MLITSILCLCHNVSFQGHYPSLQEYLLYGLKGGYLDFSHLTKLKNEYEKTMQITND